MHGYVVIIVIKYPHFFLVLLIMNHINILLYIVFPEGPLNRNLTRFLNLGQVSMRIKIHIETPYNRDKVFVILIELQHHLKFLPSVASCGL